MGADVRRSKHHIIPPASDLDPAQKAEFNGRHNPGPHRNSELTNNSCYSRHWRNNMNPLEKGEDCPSTDWSNKAVAAPSSAVDAS